MQDFGVRAKSESHKYEKQLNRVKAKIKQLTNKDLKEFKILHDQRMANSSSLMGIDDFNDTSLAITAELYLKGIKIMDLPKNTTLEKLAHNCIKDERKSTKEEKAYVKDYLGKRNRICIPRYMCIYMYYKQTYISIKYICISIYIYIFVYVYLCIIY